MAQHQPIRKTTPPSGSDIPDKLYFRIGEVARLCDVPAYVLRFWESEFPQLKPHKGGTGQRLYRRRDVEMALRVKEPPLQRGLHHSRRPPGLQGRAETERASARPHHRQRPCERRYPAASQAPERSSRSSHSALETRRPPRRAPNSSNHAPRAILAVHRRSSSTSLHSRKTTNVEMKFENEYEGSRRRKERPHSSHKHTRTSDSTPTTAFRSSASSAPAKTSAAPLCAATTSPRFCSCAIPSAASAAVSARWSAYTVASLSLSSSIKPRRRHRPVDPSKRWIDFTKHPDAPNPLAPTPTEEESHSRR